MNADSAKPHLGHAHAIDLLARMIRIRRFEDKCAELYTQEKIRGFLHLYDGEEAVAVGVIPLLDADDRIVGTYREHGHALVRGVPMATVMAEMFGKAEGCSGGRGGSMHLFSSDANFYGGNAIVGGGLPLAVGLALADRLRGEARVTACFFGEGAVAEGEFHESLNLAALWQLPVLFVCENNRYAMGTALERSESEVDIHAKAASYAIRSEAVDGMDVIAMEGAARRALDFIRKSGRPSFLECRTYRFRAHSMFDAQLYRDKAEVEAWRKDGPIERFQRWLEDNGLIRNDDLARIEGEVAAEIAAAVDFAEGGALEPLANLQRHVVSPERPSPPSPQPSTAQTVETTYREAVRAGIVEALQRDDRVFLMGEDVGRYGGCYAVSKGLLDQFGPERIRDTPLSESGFTGAGMISTRWATSLNIYTQVGLVTLMGLISKHGILIVEFANELQRSGKSKIEAIEQAAATRLRPILMTTAAMVLGVFPLIIASGAGAAGRFNMGLVICTGLTIGTLFTLFVVPAFYMLLAQDHHGEAAKRIESAETGAAHDGDPLTA